MLIVKASIKEQEKLTDEQAAAIDAAQTLAEVKDLYHPYKSKRRTRDRRRDPVGCERHCCRMDIRIYPSLERELRAVLTDKASDGAIRMFALNLKPLLMQTPVKGHVTMGLDPSYAHGCKVAVIDGTGKMLDTAVVYPPTASARRTRPSQSSLSCLP